MASLEVATPSRSAIDNLRGRVRGAVFTPDDPDYDERRRVWNAMIDRHPAVIVRCAGTADVMHAIAFARDRGLPLSVRGGGHNVAGTAVNDGGVVIDMSSLRSVQVDRERRVACVEAGATWRDVDVSTQPFGLATPGGVVSTTGVAGLTLSGGYSNQRRAHGMTIDNLVSVELVTVDGSLVRASEDENEDLFWALRGGGGNFGVVTKFELRLHDLGPDVMTLNVAYPIEQAREILGRYLELAPHTPNELTTEFVIWNLPDVPELPPELRGAPFAGVGGMYAGSVADGEDAIAPFRELANPLVDMSAPASYLDVQSELDPLVPEGMRCYWKSLYLDDVTGGAADVICERSLHRVEPLSIVVLRHLGGAISRVPPDATAFPHRDAEYLLSIDSCWIDPADTDVAIAYTREFWDALRPLSGGRTYFNFAGLMEDGDEVSRATYGANYERLAEVKGRYDPDNLFSNNQPIAARR